MHVPFCAVSSHPSPGSVWNSKGGCSGDGQRNAFLLLTGAQVAPRPRQNASAAEDSPEGVLVSKEVAQQGAGGMSIP